MILFWIYIGITIFLVFLMYLLYDDNKLIPTFLICLGWPIYFLMATISEIRRRINEKTDKKLKDELQNPKRQM